MYFRRIFIWLFCFPQSVKSQILYNFELSFYCYQLYLYKFYKRYNALVWPRLPNCDLHNNYIIKIKNIFISKCILQQIFRLISKVHWLYLGSSWANCCDTFYIQQSMMKREVVSILSLFLFVLSLNFFLFHGSMTLDSVCAFWNLNKETKCWVKGSLRISDPGSRMSKVKWLIWLKNVIDCLLQILSYTTSYKDIKLLFSASLQCGFAYSKNYLFNTFYFY